MQTIKIYFPDESEFPLSLKQKGAVIGFVNEEAALIAKENISHSARKKKYAALHNGAQEIINHLEKENTKRGMKWPRKQIRALKRMFKRKK